MQAQTPAAILIVEDEKEIRRFLRTALSEAGYKINETATLATGLIAARSWKPDLVILDLGLPDGDGLDFIREVRAWSAMPVLVLSARVEESDKVGALDAGADDYLTKPFSVNETLARVRAALRRTAWDESPDLVLRFGDVEVNREARRVLREGREVHLTHLEFRLLSTLLAHEGRVMTHRQLLREVWGPGYVEHGHYLRIYMGHLRHKLEAEPARPRHLLTEIGVGYRFVGSQ